MSQTFTGTSGADSTLLGLGNDSLFGNSGSDTLGGGAGNNTFDGGSGSDSLYAGSGNDSFLGGSQEDTIDGGAGNNTFDGGSGSDSLFAGSGNDSFLGGSQEDTIDGGAGSDTIDGGSEGDLIRGGDGADSIQGGSGTDTIQWSVGQGNDTIDGDPNNNTGSNTLQIVTPGFNGNMPATVGATLNGWTRLADVNFNGNTGQQYRYNPTGEIIFTQNVVFAICFYRGTMIATPGGERAVEDLAIGDLVLTAGGKACAIRWMGRQTVSTVFGDPLRILPVRIAAGALADGVPSRDLLLSPDHAILVEGVLIQAGALVNGTTILRQFDVPEVFTYYHVELATHDLILAEGTPAESFVDNVDRLAFDNWDEHEALYGDLPSILEMNLPRAKAQRQVPRFVRAALEARAGLRQAG